MSSSIAFLLPQTGQGHAASFAPTVDVDVDRSARLVLRPDGRLSHGGRRLLLVFGGWSEAHAAPLGTFVQDGVAPLAASFGLVGRSFHSGVSVPRVPRGTNEAQLPRGLSQPPGEPPRDVGPRVTSLDPRSAGRAHLPSPDRICQHLAHGAGHLGDSSPLTNNPVSPFTTVSRAPPESPTTMGLPQAEASMNTFPHPSTSMPIIRVRHGMAKTSPTA